jgi:hypothetical protein
LLQTSLHSCMKHSLNVQTRISTESKAEKIRVKMQDQSLHPLSVSNLPANNFCHYREYERPSLNWKL